jgi:hypothetical protein
MTPPTPNPTDSLISLERIESRIYLLRGEKVLIDSDLAELYGVETKMINRAVQRNIERFPADFMFQLTSEEAATLLRCQIGTSNPRSRVKPSKANDILKSQIVTSNDNDGRGGRRYLPYAFTEQGVAMLSSVLRSPRAVQVNIGIMRAFVRLRQLIAGHAELSKKLRALEKKYDEQFKVVFEAIRELMEPVTEEDKAREIGFHTTLKSKPAKA